jgi:hypothetical protein
LRIWIAAANHTTKPAVFISSLLSVSARRLRPERRRINRRMAPRTVVVRMSAIRKTAAQ